MAKKSSVFKLFGTSKDAEKDGIWIDYGDIRFKIARAGGSNSDFSEVSKAKTRPYRNQIDRGTLSPADDARISRDIYAEAIIRKVQVKDEAGTWIDGVPTPAGEVVPYTRANVIQLLSELPDMFRDLRECALDREKFLAIEDDADAKNS